MTPTELKEFVKEMFANALEDMNAPPEIYAKYFSEEYVQYVDGKKLNYSEFCEHMKLQKRIMKSLKVTFKYIIAEDDKVAIVIIVNMVKQDGALIEAQVNALFKIKDKKIILCDELMHIIQGKKAVREAGGHPASFQ